MCLDGILWDSKISRKETSPPQGILVYYINMAYFTPRTYILVMATSQS